MGICDEVKIFMIFKKVMKYSILKHLLVSLEKYNKN